MPASPPPQTAILTVRQAFTDTSIDQVVTETDRQTDFPERKRSLMGVDLPVTMVVVGFASLARIWGECSTIYYLPALFFFFKVEINLRILIPLFMPGSVHSGLVEMTVAQCSLTRCV